jgi:hypothetical protein
MLDCCSMAPASPSCGNVTRAPLLRWPHPACSNVPYSLDKAFVDTLIEKHNIDYIVHGDDPCVGVRTPPPPHTQPFPACSRPLSTDLSAWRARCRESSCKRCMRCVSVVRVCCACVGCAACGVLRVVCWRACGDVCACVLSPLQLDGQDAYGYAKSINRFKMIKRTEGVSTTDIVGRMLLMTKEHHVRGSFDEASDGGCRRAAEGGRGGGLLRLCSGEGAGGYCAFVAGEGAGRPWTSSTVRGFGVNPRMHAVC